MRKLVAAAAALLALGSAPAMAAGTYDGIYVHPEGFPYLSIHTNGTAIIATLYDSISAQNISISTEAGSVFPSILDFTDVFSGTINANVATVTGMTAFRACNVNVQGTFSPTAVVITVTGVSRTAQGTAQGSNCNAITPPPTSYLKVF